MTLPSCGGAIGTPPTTVIEFSIGPSARDPNKMETVKSAIRLKANAVLQESIANLLARPVGRPSNHVRRFHASFSYQAGSWSSKRQIVAKVEWHAGWISDGLNVLRVIRACQQWSWL